MLWFSLCAGFCLNESGSNLYSEDLFWLSMALSLYYVCVVDKRMETHFFVLSESWSLERPLFLLELLCL